MEFVEGVDVQRLRRAPGGERLPPAEALHVVAQMLRGLDYAHRRTDSDNRPLGIVHMDVKPANVLVSFEGEVKLADFGVARSRDARRPTVGISGTIPFMSPEQTRGEAGRPAVGRVLGGRRCCTRCSRASARSARTDDGETLYEIQLCRYRPPPRDSSEHERFEPLLRRALAREPGDRFASAGAFADAIDELMFAQGWRGGAGALRDRLRGGVPGRARAAECAVRAGQAPRGPRRHARRQPARGDGAVARRRRPPPPRNRTRQTVVAAAPRARGRRGRTRSTAIGTRGDWRRPAVDRVRRGRGRRRSSRRCRPPHRAPAPAHEHEHATPTTTTPHTWRATPTAAPPAPQERTAPVAMGSISVNASPWATVRVNGKLAGTTPILRFPVRAGRASVTIENPKLGRKQVDVKIEPKKDTPLIVDLRATAEPR